MIVVDNSWHLAEDLEVVGVGGTNTSRNHPMLAIIPLLPPLIACTDMISVSEPGGQAFVGERGTPPVIAALGF